MFHRRRRKSTSELIHNSALLVGAPQCQKSRFHMQHHAFLQALPPRGKKKKKNTRACSGSELHLGIRKWREIRRPQWNINKSDSGRSDRCTFYRHPIQKHVPVFVLCTVLPPEHFLSISPPSLLPIICMCVFKVTLNGSCDLKPNKFDGLPCFLFVSLPLNHWGVNSEMHSNRRWPQMTKCGF